MDGAAPAALTAEVAATWQTWVVLAGIAVVVVAYALAGTTDIDLAMSLDGGQSLSIAGEIGNVLHAQDADLRIEFDLYPEDALPRPARNLKEFRLTGIDAHIISETDGLELEKARIAVNVSGPLLLTYHFAKPMLARRAGGGSWSGGGGGPGNDHARPHAARL